MKLSAIIIWLQRHENDQSDKDAHEIVYYPVKNNPGRIISLLRQYEGNEYQPPDDFVLRMGQVDQINEKRRTQIFENIKDKGDIKPA